MIPFFTRKSEPAVPAASPADVDIAVDVDLDDLDHDELELTDDDFVLLEAAPPPPPLSRSVVRAALAAVAPPPPSLAPRPISEARLDTLRTKTLRAGVRLESRPPPPSSAARPAPPLGPPPEPVREARRSFSRMMPDEDAEASVADECLASIAAAASHARASDPFVPVAPRVSSPLLVRPRDEVDALLEDVPFPGALPPPSVPPARSAANVTIPPPSSSSAIALSPRLPPVSPPPFVRGSVPVARVSVPGLAEVSDANDAAETLPVPMRTPFARTTTDEERASHPSVAPSLTPSARSVTPATASKNETTVVVVRDRPRTVWVVAAAAIGALAAVGVMRVAAPQQPAVPAAAVEAPRTALAAPSAAVVRFAEEEGVSIKVPAHPPAPAPAPPASHAARPEPSPRAAPHAPPPYAPAARPTRPLHPKVSPPMPMPDGSLGLANTGKAATQPSVAAPAPTPLPLPPSGGRKRALTPEQELAEAQLRAATMR